MTRQELFEALQAAGFENARGEAELLSEAFSGNIPPHILQKRLSHYPLQYLIGRWWFWREEYEVNEHCLVPRPDTECLVEEAVRLLPERARFLDLCTGSGCIAISTLASRPDTTAAGVELYPETLELARRNAARNGVSKRLSLFEADATDIPPDVLQKERFDAILSNPPYIATGELDTLQAEVRQEPRAALDGGEDGLLFYRAILEKWRTLLTPDGFFLFEIGFDQAAALTALAAEHGLVATVKKDLGGNPRAVLLRRAQST